MKVHYLLILTMSWASSLHAATFAERTPHLQVVHEQGWSLHAEKVPLLDILEKMNRIDPGFHYRCSWNPVVSWQVEKVEIESYMQGLCSQLVAQCHQEGDTWVLTPGDEHLPIHHWSMHFRQAEDIIEQLKKSKQSLLPKTCTVWLDPRENTLWSSCAEDDWQQLTPWLEIIDQPERQIEIQAWLVAIDDISLQRLGINLQDKKTSEPFTLQGSLFHLSAPKLSSSLALLEEEGHGQILSAPKILVSNRSDARLSVGQMIPYQEKTAQGGTAIAFKPADLSLKVHVDFIAQQRLGLKLMITQDHVSAQPINGAAGIDHQLLTSSITTHNGDWVVLGGMLQQRHIKHRQGLPHQHRYARLWRWLAHKERDQQQHQLVIFLRSRIVQ